MEVYVVYGRTYWCEGVYDHEGNYFRESPIIEAYQSFDAALAKMKEYVKEAYNYLKSNHDGIYFTLNDRFAKNTTEDDLFKDYNMCFPDWLKAGTENDEEEEIEYDVCWQYNDFGFLVEWQMYAKNIPLGEDVPILAGLGVRKVELNA